MKKAITILLGGIVIAGAILVFMPEREEIRNLGAIGTPQNIVNQASQTCANTITIADYNIPSVTDGLIVVVQAASSNINGSTVTWGGTSLTKAAGAANTTNCGIWYAAVGAGNDTQDITVTMASAATCAASAFYVTGVDQTTPLDNSRGSLSGFGSNVSNTIDSNTDNAFIMDCFTRTGTGSLTVQTGQTQILSTTAGTQRYSASYETSVTTAGTYTLGRTETFINWSHSLASFKEAGGGGGGGGGGGSIISDTVIFE